MTRILTNGASHRFQFVKIRGIRDPAVPMAESLPRNQQGIPLIHSLSQIRIAVRRQRCKQPLASQLATRNSPLVIFTSATKAEQSQPRVVHCL
jgi:hypothetical protein